MAMILTYSISEGIAVGFIVYGVGMFFAGKAKQVAPVLWILMLVFIAHFTL